MKTRIITCFCALAAAFVMLSAFQKDNKKEPWTHKELMPPSELAEKLNKNDLTNIVIFNIGPSGKIKNSLFIGAAQDEVNMLALKKKLEKLPKNKEVIIYCGCCPFEHCPNIRPAFQLAKDMGFNNVKLLNMPKNLKVDWIDKGYPMQQ